MLIPTDSYFSFVRGLAADYRLTNFIATVSDRPGGIGRLTTLLGNMGASIKDMYHERAFLHSNIDHVKVKVSQTSPSFRYA